MNDMTLDGDTNSSSCSIKHKTVNYTRFCPRLYVGCKKVKVAHTRLPSVGFRSWSRFLAVSLQLTWVWWVINPEVGCYYFRHACSYPRNPYEGCCQFCCLVNRGTMGVNSLPKTVSVATAIWTRALLCLSPAREPLGYRATLHRVTMT